MATSRPVVRFHAVNAAERFLAASRARDVDAAAAELSPDVVMLSPATDDPIRWSGSGRGRPSSRRGGM